MASHPSLPAYQKAVLLQWLLYWPEEKVGMSSPLLGVEAGCGAGLDRVESIMPGILLDYSHDCFKELKLQKEILQQ